ncbi:MAG TPA: hypothetical protein VGE36_09880, partial [Roseateles sp.]
MRAITNLARWQRKKFRKSLRRVDEGRRAAFSVRRALAEGLQRLCGRAARSRLGRESGTVQEDALQGAHAARPDEVGADAG